mmetsp:Transcript_58752/g.182509  ORF Transcript_58752/g.182509 Transcript_58752/m.182509 type:complete len:344 (+) Transcript_58752:859-1890(+)
MADRHLPLVDNVQLGSVLPATNHVLGGHVDVELHHVVVLGEAVLTDVGDVTHLVAVDLQVVASVQGVEPRHRPPAALREEVMIAHLRQLAGRDVHRRLPPAIPADGVAGCPATLIAVVPVRVRLAVLPIRLREEATVSLVELHGLSRKMLLPHVALGDQPRNLRGVHAGHAHRQAVQLLQVHLQRLLEYHPPHGAAAATAGGVAAVPVPGAAESRFELLGKVQVNVLQAVRHLVSDRVLVLEDLEGPQEGVLSPELEEYADHHLVKLAVVAGQTLAKGVAKEHVLDLQLGCVVLPVDRVLRDGLEGDAPCEEDVAVQQQVPEVPMPVVQHDVVEAHPGVQGVV